MTSIPAAAPDASSTRDVKPDERVWDSLVSFMGWLDKHGESSYDHQTFFAGPLGRFVKRLYYRNRLLGTAAVSPMIFCEALFPSGRKLFWQTQRFPIADAHYAMGFALLAEALDDVSLYDRAVRFLRVLIDTRCPNFRHYCWGYPFDWVTLNGTIHANTPLVTTTPYAYEAFLNVYRIDGKWEWEKIMRSIAEHTAMDIKDFRISSTSSSCAYTPSGFGGVINASAYRAWLLTSAGVEFSELRYRRTAERNLNFVLESQRPDGSWPYAADGKRDFVDHFHTCFVLKALAKIEQLTGASDCRMALEQGVRYYLDRLLDAGRLPKPFSKAPRLTVYRRELYDYAECLNLCLLLRDRFKELDKPRASVVEDLLTRWRKPDGSFRSRELLFGWDNVPMHRWAQAQLFRSLSFLVYQQRGFRQDPVVRGQS